MATVLPELQKLDETIRQCPRCELAKSRNKAVPGEGPHDAEIMFIGEAPGWNENQQGRPFVGPAGKFLDELLASIQMRRADVFITNIVKCRPPGNRDPQPDEITACKPYLDEQIERINPLVIVTLGRHSMARFFPNEMISRIHGTARQVDGRTVVALYHPAAALHQQKLRSTLEEDFQKLPRFVAEAKARATERRPGTKPDEPPRQLTLF